MAKVVSISYVGSSASAVKAAAEVAAANEKAAATSAAAFDASTSKIGGSFSKLGKLGASFGLPFTGSLTALGTKLDQTSTKGQQFGSTLSKVGGVELLAAAAGVALIGTSAVHAAEDFDTAHARLQTAVADTGQAFSAASPGVSKLDDSFVKLGFTTTQTENALSILTSATHNVADAQKAMGAAADIARARNLDLSQVAVALSKAAEGNYTSLSRLGIVTKAQTANFHSFSDVLTYVNKVMGGQSTAFAATFAGELDQLKASANQLEVTLGNQLIPRIESLASGTVGAIQGLESANHATDGFLGKAVALGAAVPIAVFAMGKLDAVGTAVVGSFSKLGATLGITTTETEAAAAANTDLAASEGLVASGAATSTAAIGGLGLTLGAAAAALLTFQHNASSGHNPLETNFLPVPNAFDTNKAKDPFDETQVTAGQAFIATGKAAQDEADRLGVSLKGLQNASTAYANAALQGKDGTEAFFNALSRGDIINSDQAAIQDYGTGIDNSAKSLDAGQRAQVRYNLALQAYQADVAPGAHVSSSQLNTDAGNLKSSYDDLQSIQGSVNSVVGGSTASTGAAAFAYLNLGSAVQTAADALNAINSQESGKGSPFQVQIDTSAAQASLDALHGKLDTPPSGGGGTSQTATAAALDHAQKELAVRDAYRQVASGASAVTAAETQLKQARQSNIEADQSLITAEQNYRTTLKGVAADSLAAKTATEALTQAKNDAAGSNLDVRSAQRALATAKSDQRTSRFGVTDAQTTLTNDQQSGASSEQIVKDQVALTDARIAASAGADSVKQAEIDLSNAQLAAKQKTQDLTTAQKSLNTTLHGYPANSQAAKDATNQLHDAQLAAKTSSEGITTAVQGLQTANDNTATSALNLQRATADLSGKLTAASGSGGGFGKLETSAGSMITKLNDVRTAFLTLAQDSGTATAAATNSVAQGILEKIKILKYAVDTEPLLAHAFDDVLADLQGKLVTAAVQEGFNAGTNSPTTGISPAGVGPTRRAGGGPVRAGQPYLIGENGPELFQPGVSGNVVPHAALANSRPYGSGSLSIVVNVNAPIYGVNDLKNVIGAAAIRAFQEHTARNGSVPGISVSP